MSKNSLEGVTLTIKAYVPVKILTLYPLLLLPQINLDSYNASSTTVQTNVLMNNISIIKPNVLLRLLRT